MKNTVMFDFDGVINSYTSGYIEDRIPDKPVPGMLELFQALSQNGWKIVVFTTRALTLRGRDLVESYLSDYGFMPYVSDITAVKQPARVYVDDRAIRFSGDTTSLLRDILTFKSYVE